MLVLHRLVWMAGCALSINLWRLVGGVNSVSGVVHSALCHAYWGGSRRVLDLHPIGVGSACLAHHPTSGSYRLNKGLGAGLATIALIHVGCGAALWLGHQRAEDAHIQPLGVSVAKKVARIGGLTPCPVCFTPFFSFGGWHASGVALR